MKKLLVLSIMVAFVVLGAQAFASPPVKPPVEGFIIDSFTEIKADGDVTESERYNWTYFEGVGNLGATLGDCPGCATNAILQLGFAEGAEIAYQQDFAAIDGTTNFTKTFKAVSHTSTTVPDNLTVDKDITYDNLGGTGVATHLEKVGLSVVSVGAPSSPVAAGNNLLSLCPWATSQNGSTAAYPPTNEGIAAASEFSVKNIVFASNSAVNSVNNPALSYEVVATGEGTIAAGFVVELWEGPEGDIWTSMPSGSGACATCFVPEPTPLLASRTSYSEHASADGVWSFVKKVSYESVMPTGTQASTCPINQVP